MSNFIKHSFFSQIWNDAFYDQNQVFKRFWSHKNEMPRYDLLAKSVNGLALLNFLLGRIWVKSTLRVLGLVKNLNKKDYFGGRKGTKELEFDL